MTPPASATARQLAPRRPEPRRALLPVATTRQSAVRQSPSRATRTRRRLSPVAVALSIVVASLLAVVGGNMELASGQLQLEQVQSTLAGVESSYAAAQVTQWSDESPAHVAMAAERAKLVPAAALLLPGVTSLSTRLAPPTFSSAPCCSLTPGA